MTESKFRFGSEEWHKEIIGLCALCGKELSREDAYGYGYYEICPECFKALSIRDYLKEEIE